MVVVVFCGETKFFILASDETENGGNFLHKVGEIFADHHLREGFQSVRTVHFGGGVSCDLDEIFVVIDDRSWKIFKGKSGLCSHRIGCVFDDFAEQRLCFFTHFRGVGAGGSLHNNFVSVDVKTLAAGDLADGDDKRIQWVVHAGDDSLDLCDDMGRSQDRINPLMWSRAVSRNPFYFNAEIIAACHARTSLKIHIRRIEIAPDMCPVNGIYIVQKTMFYIVFCTVTGLFRSLKNDLYIAF